MYVVLGVWRLNDLETDNEPHLPAVTGVVDGLSSCSINCIHTLCP